MNQLTLQKPLFKHLKTTPLFLLLCGVPVSLFAADIVPTGTSNNALYYHIGGGADLPLPPVQNSHTINLNADVDLSPGYTCGAFNPALSITNSLNNLKSSADNIEQAVISSATGSLAQMPMYLLAQANPTAYNLLNNALLAAHQQLDIATKSCEAVKAQIAKGENPYHDWASISLGNQWKQELSLTASGQKDILEAKKDLDVNAGNDGVPWVQGSQSPDSSLHAGGLNQPVIHVIADTVKAGYNALLMRDLNDNSPAPTGSELASEFSTPQAASNWITNVVGDQTITTCNAASCKSPQGGVSGRGLLPWITTCSDQNQNDCADHLRGLLANLVSGQSPLTKENLTAVSTNDLVISPQVINAIRHMDSTQQSLIVGKLAQEVATQRVVNRALMARTLLQTGSQVPVIAANKPAQIILQQAITQLDKGLQSLAFAAQIRKQMLSDTVSSILNYQNSQQAATLSVPSVTPTSPLMENSALQKGGQ